MEKISQTDKLYHLLSDSKKHRTDEIMKSVYGFEHLGLARVGARIYDVQKKYNIRIEGEKDKIIPSLYWYWIVPAKSFIAVKPQKIEFKQSWLPLKLPPVMN